MSQNLSSYAVVIGSLRVKCVACRAFYLFLLKFNKFNNTGARMLDSIYHMTLKLLQNHIFVVKTTMFCHLVRNVIMDVIT